MNFEWLLFVSFAVCVHVVEEAEISAEIRVAELRGHVHRLSSREFGGRRGAGAARTSQHIAEQFKAMGLQPAFGESYFQPIPWLFKASGEENGFAGRNVGGVLEGGDADLKSEWIVLSAHFDHLGTTETGHYPGADDNASGVAALLEIAERFTQQKGRPKRSLLFVAFDQEEYGLLGSRHFANHPPRPIEDLKVFMTADLIGRSMYGLTRNYLFVLGSESSPRLKQLVDATTAEGLTIGRLGADIVGTRSDYGPFRDKKIPFLFFSTGEHEDYHRVTDTAEKLDYDQLARISGTIAELTERLADANDAPVWQAVVHDEKDLSEARLLRLILENCVNEAERLKIRPIQLNDMISARDRLSAIIARGRIGESERAWLVNVCRAVMLMLRG